MSLVLLNAVAMGLAIAGASTDSEAAKFFLEDGDRVLFYGDSITAAGKYTNLLELMIRTRYPKLRFDFYNVAMPSDSSWGGPKGSVYERLKRDVQPFSPTVAFVMLGMNDGGYVSYSSRLHDNFDRDYNKLIAGIRENARGVRLALALTSPYDSVTKRYSGERPTFANNYNEALVKYGDVVRNVAQKSNGLYLDCNSPTANALSEAVRRDILKARAIIPDSVHPSDAGHLILAAEIAQQFRLNPTVSEVEIDAQKQTATTVNSSVSMGSGLSWRQRDNCLPVPTPTDSITRFVSSFYPFNDTLNRQILRVTNLPKGDYELSIGEKVVGQFSSDFFTIGINLAEYETPMLAESRELLRVIERKNKIQHNRWYAMRSGGEVGLMMDSISEATREVQARMNAALVPKTYVYKLRKVTALLPSTIDRKQ